jgi:hypothetical protein
VATSDPLVDNLIVFQKLFTVIATASHGKLWNDSWIQSTLTHPVSWRFISMLSSYLHLDLLNGLFPQTSELIF